MSRMTIAVMMLVLGLSLTVPESGGLKSRPANRRPIRRFDV